MSDLDRARERAQALREFLRSSARTGYMQRKDPVDRTAYLQADAFNYIHGMSRADSVTLDNLKQALTVAAHEIDTLTRVEQAIADKAAELRGETGE